MPEKVGPCEPRLEPGKPPRPPRLPPRLPPLPLARLLLPLPRVFLAAGWRRFTFLAELLAGVHALSASSAVSASMTALTYSQASLEIRISTLGESGAFGPLKIGRQDLWTPTNLVAGLLSNLGRRFIPWSTHSCFSPFNLNLNLAKIPAFNRKLKLALTTEHKSVSFYAPFKVIKGHTHNHKSIN